MFLVYMDKICMHGLSFKGVIIGANRKVLFFASDTFTYCIMTADFEHDGSDYGCLSVEIRLYIPKSEAMVCSRSSP